MQLLVLGMHRSGTSMVTRLVHAMGASLGPEFRQQDPDRANPLGYWERLDLQDLHTHLLRACDGEWFHPDTVDLGRMGHLEGHLRARARALIEDLDAACPWVVKDPRMCLLLPFWLPLLEQPLAVFVYRHPLEVAESLAVRDGLPLAVGVALWQRTVLRCLRDLVGTPVVWVSQERLLTEPVAGTAELHDRLCSARVAGLTLPDPESVAELIDPRLYRARQRSGCELTSGQSDLWRYLRAEPESVLEGEIPEGEEIPWVDDYCRLMLEAGDVPARLNRRSDPRQEWWEVTLRRDLSHLGDLSRSFGESQEAWSLELRARLETVEQALESFRAEAGPLGVGRSSGNGRSSGAARERGSRDDQLRSCVARYRRLTADILASRRWRLGDRLISWLNTFRSDRGRPSALAEAARLEREVGELFAPDSRTAEAPDSPPCSLPTTDGSPVGVRPGEPF